MAVSSPAGAPDGAVVLLVLRRLAEPEDPPVDGDQRN
jgi:hypothetical protein